jgi:Raf kinase inhibitor-like YbhB/YbcL family protein
MTRSIFCCLLAATVLVAVPVRAAGFDLTSPAVADGARLPLENAGPAECGGKNVSLPLRWTNAPSGTRSFAVLAIDLDGGRGLTSVHWVAYGIAPDATGLPAGIGSAASTAYVGGTNTRKLSTYFGPCSRPGDEPHHYAFTVLALDFDSRALPPGLTRDALFAVAQGHALGSASLFVRYGR